MGRVVWTEPAIDDLTKIIDYIAKDSPRHALQVGERIYRTAERLEQDERAGGIVLEFNLDRFRELLVRPYRVAYELRGPGCYIVAVVHGSRDLPQHVMPSGPVQSND